jgi:autotransporter adhesin
MGDAPCSFSRLGQFQTTSIDVEFFGSYHSQVAQESRLDARKRGPAGAAWEAVAYEKGAARLMTIGVIMNILGRSEGARRLTSKAISKAVTMALAVAPMSTMASGSLVDDALEPKRSQCYTGERWTERGCVIDLTLRKGERDDAEPGNVEVGDTYFKARGLDDGTDNASASGANAVAAGASSKALGLNSTALGVNAEARTQGSVAIGSSSIAAGGDSAIALGANASALGGGAQVAIGSGAKTWSYDTVALGASAEALSSASVAIGTTSKAEGGSAIAIGSTSNADGASAIALGMGASAGGGGRQVAIGAGAATWSYNTIALGASALAKGAESISVGFKSSTTVMSDIAVGANARASGVFASAGSSAVALGAQSRASGWGAIALGEFSSANAGFSMALGGLSNVDAQNGTAIGYQARVLAAADNAVALGVNSVADRANSVSVGSGNMLRQITHVAAGTEDTDAVNLAQLRSAGLVGGDGSMLNAVAYDAGSAYGRITFGGAGGTLLGNVMAGSVTPGSTDAVNGGQLWVMQDQVDRLGDRVGKIENGNLPPVDPANPGNPGNSGDHFASSGDSAHPSVASGAGSVAMGESAQATADNSVALGSNSVADRPNSVSVGSEGNERQVTNVAAGTADTDAVNMAQLNGAKDWAREYTDQQVSALDRRVTSLGRRADAGTAAAMAMANLPQAYAPNQNSVGAGVGTFNGESAVAMGMSAISESGRWVFRVSATANTQGDKGAGFGAAMVW